MRNMRVLTAGELDTVSGGYQCVQVPKLVGPISGAYFYSKTETSTVCDATPSWNGFYGPLFSF